jgi:prolyl-tRNA synthetase
MGTVIEKLADKSGIIWPEELTPYDVHLLNINGAEKETDEVYKKLEEAGYSVLWDDRDERAGVKLADSDLLGIKTRIVVSPKTVEVKKIEVKERNKNKEELVTLAEFIKRK